MADSSRKPHSLGTCPACRQRPSPAVTISKHSLTDFMEFHGDRHFGDDPAIIGGIAKFHGKPVTVIAQEKGTNTKENIDTILVCLPGRLPEKHCV